MLHLHRRSLVEDKAAWEQAGIALYQFDTEAVEAATKEAPQWIHFGGGNIFRAFIAALQQHLLDEGLAKTGIITAETYDEEVIEQDVYKRQCLYGMSEEEKESLDQALHYHGDVQPVRKD